MRPSRRDTAAVHIPVMRAEITQHLQLQPGLLVVDATVGAGGHAYDILEQIMPGGTLVGIDRDPMMLALAAKRLESSEHFDPQDCHLRQDSYVSLPDNLSDLNLGRADRVLADLGLSSDQLADVDRGFSFQSDGLLDLRFDVSVGEPAFIFLATRSADALTAIFRDFGEERHAAAIAQEIVASRKRSRIRTARDLAALVESLSPRRSRQSTHPATRIFQALRIAVNEELAHVAQLVDDILPDVITPGGRAAIITFHSLEDRIVKRAFRHRDVWEMLTKKPIEATPAEQRHNPRSRSAKLRVVVRK